VHRRSTVDAYPADGPYADYLAWVKDGRPALEPEDLLARSAIALPPRVTATTVQEALVDDVAAGSSGLYDG
jgi:hypothetical protein